MIYYNKTEFQQNLASSGILLGLDIGQKKVGIAISDAARFMAMPLKVISLNINEIKLLISEYKAAGLVIGLPLSMNGEKNEQCLFVEKVAAQILEAIELPIFLSDERMTTRMANTLLKQGNIKRKDRDKVDDMVSASVILESGL
ncbi:MAG: Holliday junction resolvase RuvX [Alphaproteobacteria bacterium]|nr:Holliday junction resolvase RuvX [Alphaproteobacteria bacterium]OJV13511.1 MAG: hypothetical protein BGO27_04820 [Alphaproteobacteria bacterium 33-17]